MAVLAVENAAVGSAAAAVRVWFGLARMGNLDGLAIRQSTAPCFSQGRLIRIFLAFSFLFLILLVCGHAMIFFVVEVFLVFIHQDRYSIVVTLFF